MRRPLLWWACASGLLAGGFALYLLLAFAIERPADATAARELRAALAIYGKVVLLKGLLPQLWIALALAGLLERGFLRARSRAGLAVLLAVSAGLAGLPVAAILLRANLPWLPRVVFSGPANFALTWLQMSAAVVAAALFPRLVWPTLRPP
jgi:hypothetical protein